MKLYKFSILLIAATFVLLSAGGLVTSHEAGLAVPDWPLSYGQWFPPMVGNIFWEHGHRMIAGTVGLLTLILAICVQRSDKRAWVKKFAWIMVLTVVAQALFGGLTVLLMLPPAVSIVHACLGQIFFCLTIAMGLYQSPAFQSDSHFDVDPKIKRVAFVTAGVIFFQLILGAVVRHTGHMHAVMTHILVALAVIAHIFMVIGRLNKVNFYTPGIAKAALVLGIGVVVQVILGFGAFILTHLVERSYAPSITEVIFTASHQSLGALLLGVIVWVALRLKRS